jgi:hypothetical protein
MATLFHDLVREKYIARGQTASTAVQLISIRTEVCLGSVWEAYRGRRVAPKTVKRLRDWAFNEHGVEDLDIESLLWGPAQPRSAQR